jgi:hypothetical protein
MIDVVTGHAVLLASLAIGCASPAVPAAERRHAPGRSPALAILQRRRRSRTTQSYPAPPIRASEWSSPAPVRSG